MTTVMSGKTIAKKSIRVLSGLDDLRKISALLTGKNVVFGLDTETTGLSARSDKLIALLFGTATTAYIFDVRPYYSLLASDQAEWRQVVAEFIGKIHMVVGHNLKFDWLFLHHTFGVRLINVVDTMLQEKVLRGCGSGMYPGFTEDSLEDIENVDESEVEAEPEDEYEGLDEEFWSRKGTVDFGLKAVARRYGEKMSKEERNWFIGLDLRKSEWLAPFPQDQIDYMGHDVFVPMAIYKKQQQALLNMSEGMLNTALLENAALPAFASMEYAGTGFDEEMWRDFLRQKIEDRDTRQRDLVEKLTPYLHSYYNRNNAKYVSWVSSRDEVVNKARDVYRKGFETGEKFSGLSLSAYIKQQVGLWEKHNPMPAKPSPVALAAMSAPIKLSSSKAQLVPALQEYGIDDLASASAKVLKYYRFSHPIVADILRWRKSDKFINSFGEKLIAKQDIDGRIHAEYNQIGARTGRTSCKRPNWQQIPSHESIILFDGSKVNFRRCFIARTGYRLLTADLPNIELRILADMSSEPKMLSAFATPGADLHTDTAFMMFPDKLVRGVNDVAEEKFPDSNFSYRDIGKKLNFGLAYGMAAAGLADQLEITPSAATVLIERHKTAYPQAHAWLGETGHGAIRDGYTETIGGRRRFFADLWGERSMSEDFGKPEKMSWVDFKNSQLRGSVQARMWGSKYGRAMRQGMNAPIQGTSADIIKYAMVLLYSRLPHGVELVAMVHDELVCECPEGIVSDVAPVISDCMREACMKYLKIVAIPEMKVSIEKYWAK